MKKVVLVVFLSSLFCNPYAFASEKINLSGKWRFALDRTDSGISEQWFGKNLDGRISLPGSLPEQGIGDEVTVETKWVGGIVDRSWFTSPEYEKYRKPENIKIPFWLQPEIYYSGAAWYHRDINIPDAWKGKRVELLLERVHWETQVWVDGRAVGTNNALATPHIHDLGVLDAGKHRVAVRVDNRLVVDIGVNSHSVSDHTQGNWNGMVGRLELQARPTVWIEDLQLYPRLAAKSVMVKGRLGNATGKTGTGKLVLAVESYKLAGNPAVKPLTVDVRWDDKGGVFETNLLLGDKVEPWDEFHPALYMLKAVLDDGSDTAQVVFGLREIGTQGTQFVLNGRKIFFRGTLECCIFPKTGNPPTDVESWKRIINVVKSHGLNHMRFHSWCPPEAAFIAADELGFYYQVECSSWANQSTTLGDGKPVDQWIYDETDRILKVYGNHPSFLLMPYGNEPGGKKHKEYLAQWVNHFKAADTRRLFAAGAGWPEITENQYHNSPGPRVQGWGQGLKSRINAKPPETMTDYRDYIDKRNIPVISHEIGQWCVYPNFDEIRKYTGYLKPKNFEIFRDSLKANHMGRQARDFLFASGRLQTLCYKEEIESALRTKGMGGFQLLDLHDFPGQGTALVGVLDPFWESKGYVTAKEYSRFCNSTVPLVRLPRRVFTVNEKLEADIEVAHFGPVPLENAVVAWKLVADNGVAVFSGRLPAQTIPIGNGVGLGHVSIDLESAPAPVQCKLIVGLEKTEFENDWDVWIYPAKVNTEIPQGITVVGDWNQEALSALAAGEKVFLMIPPARVKGDGKRGKIELGFSSIFWNTAWTRGQAPHTLGILCNPKHEAFAAFPTDSWSNWQWWYLVTRAGAMILDDMPAGLEPIVQVVDDWFTNRRLGLVFEAKVGKGKLLVCSVDLKNDMDSNPVARQLLSSLMAYMAGKKFNPKVAIAPDAVAALIGEISSLQLKKLGAKVLNVDSEDRVNGNVAMSEVQGRSFAAVAEPDMISGGEPL